MNILEKTESRFDHNNLFIKRVQLNYEGVDFFDDIPSICVVCKDNSDFQVLIIKIEGLASYGSGGIELKYMVKCMNCGDTYDIDDANYSLIKPFPKLNETFKSGKISDEIYQIKNEKYITKLAKKYRTR